MGISRDVIEGDFEEPPDVTESELLGFFKLKLINTFYYNTGFPPTEDVVPDNCFCLAFLAGPRSFLSS